MRDEGDDGMCVGALMYHLNFRFKTAVKMEGKMDRGGAGLYSSSFAWSSSTIVSVECRVLKLWLLMLLF